MTEIENAVEALSEAFRDDESFAHSWHCNLAMAFYDSFPKCLHPEKIIECHKLANEGAARFMKNAFGVDTSE